MMIQLRKKIRTRYAKKNEFKLYINVENQGLWNVVGWCDSNNIVASDFICKASLEKFNRDVMTPTSSTTLGTLDDKIPYKHPLPTIEDPEALETSKMLASGEWEIVDSD